jgi:hypothetical protein
LETLFIIGSVGLATDYSIGAVEASVSPSSDPNGTSHTAAVDSDPIMNEGTGEWSGGMPAMSAGAPISCRLAEAFKMGD